MCYDNSILVYCRYSGSKSVIIVPMILSISSYIVFVYCERNKIFILLRSLFSKKKHWQISANERIRVYDPQNNGFVSFGSVAPPLLSGQNYVTLSRPVCQLKPFSVPLPLCGGGFCFRAGGQPSHKSA